MNPGLYTPNFANSADCGFYGADFPYNQQGHYLISSRGMPFGNQINQQTMNTQLCTSGMENYSTYDVSGMDLTQLQHTHDKNITYSETQAFGYNNCESRSTSKGKHAPDESFLCEVCGLGFSQQSSLTAHSRIHSGEGPFSCKECDEEFTSQESLCNHQSVHTQERRFECDLCGRKFPRKQQMQFHRVTHTGERPYVCEVCQKAFPLKVRLRKHMLVHTDERPHVCDQCNKKFKTRRDLKTHLRFHGNEKPFLCEFCPRRFFTRTHLNLHRRVHTRERAYSCPKCPVKYANRVSFKKHVQNCNGPKEAAPIEDSPPELEESDPQLFTCDLCREGFSEQYELENHLLHHQREKPFPCFLCGIRFYRFLNLKTHMRIMHRLVESFLCETCNKIFFSKDELHNHFLSPSHKCPQGEQKFKLHSKVHDGTNNPGMGEFPCLQCGKIFTCKSEHQSHMLYHARQHFKCTVCSKKFSSRSNLNWHIRFHCVQIDSQTGDLIYKNTASVEENHQNIRRSSRTRQKVYTCIICREEFPEQWELEKHRLHHKREKSFPCFKCGVGFFRSLNLRVHLNTIHAKSELFSCKTCDKSFVSKSLLRKHSVYHSLPALKFFSKVRSTKIHFGKSKFIREKSLQDYILLHSEKKWYHCKQCSKKFINRYQSRAHTRAHTVEKPHACPVCHVRYSRRDCFLMHMRHHSGELTDLQVIEVSAEQNLLSKKNISCDIEGNESIQSQLLGKQITSKKEVKEFKKQECLRLAAINTLQFTPAESISSGVEVDTKPHSLAVLAGLANRFISNS